MSHDGSVTGAAMEAGDQAAGQTAKDDQRSRHQFWTKRKLPEGRGMTWRPTKRHRVSAKHWMVNLDNQLKQSTQTGGLAFFQQGFQNAGPGVRGVGLKSRRVGHSSAGNTNNELLLFPGRWKDWRSWPHLGVAMDQGTDGMAASWFMLHKLMNCTFWTDWSHGAWNDCKVSLKDNHLMGFWMLAMVLVNIPHGPFNDDIRFSQVNAAWDECKQNFKADSCPLFMEYAAGMLEDMGGTSALGLEPGAEASAALWDHLMEDPPLRRKGYKCNLNRFFGSTKVIRDECTMWHKKLFQYEYTALECDMLGTARVKKIMIKDADVEAQEAAHTTDSGRPCAGEKALRSCCQNALVMGVAFLREQQHKFILKIITCTIQPLEDWHGEQNHTLRDATASSTWLLSQLQGAYMKHTTDILGLLSKPSALEECGFELPEAPFKAGSRVPSGTEDHAPFLKQDQMADLMGDFALSLACSRVVRGLHLLRGWPFRMAALSGPRQLVDATVQDFKADFEAFLQLQVHDNPTKAMLDILARSSFNQISVWQYVEAASP